MTAWNDRVECWGIDYSGDGFIKRAAATEAVSLASSYMIIAIKNLNRPGERRESARLERSLAAWRIIFSTNCSRRHFFYAKV